MVEHAPRVPDVTPKPRQGHPAVGVSSGGGPRVAVGRIVAPHGIRGEVRLLPYAADPGRYRRLREVFIDDRPYVVSFAREHGNVIRIGLEGVTDRNAAEGLRGQEVFVPRSERPPVPPGRYYVDDLLGLRVTDLDGADLGVVSDVESLPGQDLLHVRLENGREALVPVVRAFVRRVDLEGGTVSIDVVPGLFPESTARTAPAPVPPSHDGAGGNGHPAP